MRFILLLLLCCLSLPLKSAEYDQGRWYFQYPHIALERVLQDIEASSSARFERPNALNEAIDADFSSRSLDEGIKRLLADYNYMFQYRRDTATQESYPYIVILGRKPDRRAALKTATLSAPVTPAPAANSEPAELILRREGQQPYRTAGTINGHKVNFLVDTGASMVALSASLARRLGLRFGAQRSVSTANGRTQGHQTILQNVQLGTQLSLGQVEAIILPRMSIDDQVLLGMNVLERFKLIQHQGELIIRPYQ
jgi:aspartyl protease family protein